MKAFTVDLDDDTYNYLEFLERTRFIDSKGEAVRKALALFKKLSMHDWLPDIYRIGNNRIILMDRGMLLDIFELLTEFEIYRAFRDIDLTRPDNWMIVLKELENFGWGVFSRIGNEIKVEYCAVPTQYLRGYLETMFKRELEEHRTQVEDLTIFIVGEPKEEAWR
ncbi:hypothetical protein AC482_00425 [miscellaneous Crenarchaeota group-15 archaeon DG-45]|uniref:Uncharacterized protein n=1 Tax=miscellaneous Crenarchaeota group-15 archaeon DG-45 TaxID=1685127 RepID=A0A0M0BTQ7_9ARCH|nr:MAG: hypothetical protein AC482_00425 [miscellaneous Crenarchaeota group-15 archaeon DG-45]